MSSPTPPPPPPPPPPPGAPGMPPPGFGAPQERSGKALASMICGIIGLLVAGVILGLVAIGLSVAARNDMKRQPGRYSNAGQATAGLVLGIIDVVLGIVFVSMIM